ncbi:MAG: GNAT family N-acetyltransferase [Ignavibacteriales bacterium]|nr:GNAT family N-acetyltransferase [Ignavibacteriales bacterium]
MSFSITPYTDAARDELLKLWATALPLDAITVDTLETRVLLDENFDPETFLLARSNGTLTGFVLGIHAKRMHLGDADPAGDRCWITALGVHPDSDVNEIGGLLLSEVEKKFKALGKKECRVSGYPPGYFTPGIDVRTYKHYLDLFTAHSYEVFHEAISMDAPIVLFTVPEKTVGIEKALNEDGIKVRSYRRGDLVKFMDFLEKTMPSDWVRVERRNLHKIAEGGFHPEQVMVVTKGDEIIGYCQFEGSHFGPFGVSDAYQGKGIGTVLLARTLERMQHEGYHDAWVMWTDDVAAKVYGKFGFKETRRFAMLKKDISAT